MSFGQFNDTMYIYPSRSYWEGGVWKGKNVGSGDWLTSLTSESLYWKPLYLHVCPTPMYRRISCISQYWVVGSSFRGLRDSPVRTPIYICMIAPISVL